jgi:alkaline phosphatase D
MALSRRDFLERAAALGATMAALPTIGCGTPDEGGPDDGFPVYEWDGEPGPETTFSHGVASGDPLTDAVLLWTRV